MLLNRIAGFAAGTLVMSGALFAQTTASAEAVSRDLARAEAQIQAAERAEAALHAQDLLREARERLDAARLNASSSNRAVREDAQRRAVEALEAASTAETVARYLGQVREANRLRADVVRLGGTPAAAALEEASFSVGPRGTTATERVAAARAALERALRAGAREVQPERFGEILQLHDTAEDLSKNSRTADTARHLAYVAEMRASRLEAEIRGGAAERVLPQLQLESSRLGRAAGERAAAEERRLREQAEQQARAAAAEAERARLAAEAQARQAAADAERARLEAERQAAAANENARAAQAQAEAARAQLEDRARAEAEQRQRLEQLEARLAEIAETRRDESGLVVTLPGIYFDTGRSLLKPGAREALTRIAQGVRESGTAVTVRIIGHTDSVGAAEYNQRLSLERARAVRDFLSNTGLEAASMMIEGRGEDAPIADNSTAAGRQQNRRVELMIRQQTR